MMEANTLHSRIWGFFHVGDFISPIALLKKKYKGRESVERRQILVALYLISVLYT